MVMRMMLLLMKNASSVIIVPGEVVASTTCAEEWLMQKMDKVSYLFICCRQNGYMNVLLAEETFP